MDKHIFKIILIIVGISIAIFVFRALDSENSDFSIKTNKDAQNSEYVGDVYRNTRYNFRIIFPKGWDVGPGNGPNIVQKAVSGNHTIGVLVKEIPGIQKDLQVNDIYNTTREYAQESTSFLQESFSDVSTIAYGETHLDNRLAYWVKYSMEYSVLDISVEGIQTVFQTFKNGTLYSITIGSTAEEFESVESELLKSVDTFVFEDY